MQFGCKLRVFAFSGYANIFTLSYSYTMLYCAWGGGGGLEHRLFVKTC